MEHTELEKRLSLLTESLKPQIPERVYMQTVEVIAAGEYGVALENLCSNLFEFDVVISKDIFAEIVSIGRSMNLSQNTWKDVAVS